MYITVSSSCQFDRQTKFTIMATANTEKSTSVYSHIAYSGE